MWPGVELSRAGEDRVRPGSHSSARRPNPRDAGAYSRGWSFEPELTGATRGLALRGDSQGARRRGNALARWGNSPEARATRSPGEHRPSDRPLARVAVVEWNGLSRGAKLRSGRAGRRIRWARPFREVGAEKRARQRVTLSVLATPGNRRPGLPVRPALTGEPRREVGAPAKGAAKSSVRAAPLGWSSANPQGSRRPARAGTAPREGKALKGDSRDASGMKQGREASGRHGNGGFARIRACRVRSQNRREGQEPWGRHRWGPGDLHPPCCGRKIAVGRNKGHPACSVRGSKNPGEAKSRARRARITRKHERSCVTEQGQSVQGTVLQESKTPREELRA